MYSRSAGRFRRRVFLFLFQPESQPLEDQTKKTSPTQSSEQISESNSIQKDFTKSLHRLEQNYYLERRSIW